MPSPKAPISLFTLPLRRLAGASLPQMTDLTAEKTTLLSHLRRIRYVSVFLGFCNLSIAVLGFFLGFYGCSAVYKAGFIASALISGFRVVAMVGGGVAQHEIAEMIAKYPFDEAAGDAAVRRARRLRYKRWLWWTRLGMAVTVLQFLGAVYLTYVVISTLSNNGSAISCHIGQHTDSLTSEKILIVSFLALVWLVVVIQCFTGSDILRWRSFYATHDTAWKAHYREVFDHGIREVLCCLGRAKYLSVLDEDEVYSVARVLGDLLAYRASGTGHLELLAGLALLQSHKQSVNIQNDFVEAPTELIKEAAFFHQFAEAAYTGPLLDFGRNPILFPCAWLYRQGVFTPWTRNSRPLLEGDNWWRGHATAFLKFVNLPANVLRQGRVNQTRRGAAYFVLVLHDRRSVLIAVRGTETPEDLITDGLCRECALSAEDLDGILNGEHIPDAVKHKVLSSFPHYGHAGIVECARELCMQIDGHQGGKDGLHAEKPGFLSSLLSQQGECYGYNIHIVGHSLGGSIATLLGVRLYGRYPNLNVYAYGSLPCLDAVIAEACSSFVTTMVYNDEFSARLSINSITRLRAAAISALSDDSSADSAIIQKLARRILHMNKYQENGESRNGHALTFRSTNASVETNHVHKRRNFKSIAQGICLPNKEPNLEERSLLDASDSEITVNYSNEFSYRNSADECLFNGANSEQSSLRSNKIISINDQTSQCVEAQSSAEVSLAPPEMFLAGRIIHIVQEPARIMPLWKKWNLHGKEQVFRAVLTDREIFKDIVVTPFMFIDHLPWRCHYAMQRVLEMRQSQRTNSDTSKGEDLA